MPGQKVSRCLRELARQFVSAVHGQMGQKVLLVLREQARQFVPKNPDRLICSDIQGQGCRNGRTVFLQRRHKLPEHSTPREVYNAAPRAPAARGLPYQSAAAMRPRRNVRLAVLARGHVPLCFSVLSGQRPASSYLGLASRAKLSGVVCVHVLIEFQAGPYLHDQARGCSRYFPRLSFPYSMQSISMPYMPKPHKHLACAVCAASSF